MRFSLIRAFGYLVSGHCTDWGGRKHFNEDWVILEAVDEAMLPVPDGTLSATVLLTVLANDVQPFIRYDLGDCVRFYKDSCPCGSPFRSFQVEGRQATLVRVGEVTLSPLVIRFGARACPAYPAGPDQRERFRSPNTTGR